MSSDTNTYRAQTLANAKLLFKAAAESPSSALPSLNSQSTLVAKAEHVGEQDVVVFGTTNDFTAAVMVGLTPAIEGESAPTPEAAMRKLYLAICELLKMYIPKVGSHQRNIHGGGVFDEDMINADIVEAQKKLP